MTVRVTTLKGVAAGEYYVDQLPSYYVDADEPAGIWHGHGAQLLGLAGEVGDAEFLAVMAGATPDGLALLGRRYGEESVRGFDVTCSAPKSVSVLFALSDSTTRAEVLASHDVAVAGVIGWIESHAHTRFRISGEIAVVDAEGIVVAAFRQHTSRALDPQLHTHVVSANRVLSPDGRWLALDARTIKLDQRTLSALYHAGLRAELTRRLGVGWLPVVNGLADIAGVPDEVLEEFSTRTAHVDRRVAVKLDRFVDTMGRQPTARERWRLEREAVIDSRPAKAHGVDPAAMHERWTTQVVDIGHDPARVVADAVGRVVQGRSLDDVTRAQMGERAVEALSDKQSTWRPAEVVRELAATTPTDVIIPADRLVAELDRLGDEMTESRLVDLCGPVPVGVALRRDGRPVTESVADRALTTPEILAEERWLLEWADQRLAADAVDRHIATRAELTVPQAETAAAVAGDRDLVLVVGPAGTGKTTALRPGVEHLHTQRRRVFGVAPSAVAAEVLATETAMATDTIDKLLTEHALGRAPQLRYDLSVGATVIVDEAAMVPTPRLADLARLADQKGWRVVLVGDPLQFSAVGRGGMFGLLVDTHGAIELDRVHRFVNHWERDASLRLRCGDPTVVDVYEHHGRLHGGTQTDMEREIVAAWWHTTRTGATAAMMTPTNDTVVQLNTLAQQQRISTGELDPTTEHMTVGPYEIFVGDEISTRRNDRTLITDTGQMVRNRARWHVDALHHDSSLTVTGSAGTIRLPASYVHDHVELAYAQTSHANQARTVDHSYVLLDGPTDARGIYVPLSRGRHTNHAFVVTHGEQTPADVLTEALCRDWIDQPAHVRRAELQPSETIEPDLLTATQLRTLLNRYIEIDRQLAATATHARQLERRLLANQHARDQTTRTITDARWRIERNAQIIAELDRPLRRRNNRREIERATQLLANEPLNIANHQQHLQELHAQRQGIDADARLAERAALKRPMISAEQDQIRCAIHDDRQTRGGRLAQNPPLTFISTLGVPPEHAAAQDRWEQAAGAIHQHRITHDVTDAHRLLGHEPQRWATDTYAFTYRQATDAVNDLQAVLDHALGPHEPSLAADLGLEL